MAPIQTAVILAAGKGRRLHPLTLDRSKAMLPVAGQPLVGRVVELFMSAGISDFILVAQPGDEELRHYFETQPHPEARFRLAFQLTPLGMANALMQAAPLLDSPFLLAACDNLFPLEGLRALLKRWEQTPNLDGLLALMPVEPERLGSVGIVELEGQQVRRIVEKPPAGAISSGTASLPLYTFTPTLLEWLPQVPLSPRGEYELQDAIQMLIDAGRRVEGILLSGRMTITDADDLLNVNRAYLRQGKFLASEEIRQDICPQPPVLIDPGVELGPGCCLGPEVYLERGCIIGKGVRLKNTVVLRGSQVPDEADLSEVVIAPANPYFSPLGI